MRKPDEKQLVLTVKTHNKAPFHPPFVFDISTRHGKLVLVYSCPTSGCDLTFDTYHLLCIHYRACRLKAALMDVDAPLMPQSQAKKREQELNKQSRYVNDMDKMVINALLNPLKGLKPKLIPRKTCPLSDVKGSTVLEAKRDESASIHPKRVLNLSKSISEPIPKKIKTSASFPTRTTSSATVCGTNVPLSMADMTVANKSGKVQFAYDAKSNNELKVTPNSGSPEQREVFGETNLTSETIEGIFQQTVVPLRVGTASTDTSEVQEANVAFRSGEKGSSECDVGNTYDPAQAICTNELHELLEHMIFMDSMLKMTEPRGFDTDCVTTGLIPTVPIRNPMAGRTHENDAHVDGDGGFALTGNTFTNYWEF